VCAVLCTVVELARAVVVLGGEGVAQGQHELVEAHELVDAQVTTPIQVKRRQEALQRSRTERELWPVRTQQQKSGKHPRKEKRI
jgi:hypothetical protein